MEQKCGILALAITLATCGMASGNVARRCEPVTIPLCRGLSYNSTLYPNLLNHLSQDDAGLEVHQFFPLVKVRCSPHLQWFLCQVYAPQCTATFEHLLPCRSLCMAASDGCRTLMERFGFQWPESLNCQQYPTEGPCIAPNIQDSEETDEPGADDVTPAAQTASMRTIQHLTMARPQESLTVSSNPGNDVTKQTCNCQCECKTVP
ncbi:frizzled-1-like [Ptychodera flava]|uniref:frizzled-1-like n=1 Tax=Ptychodera flava TaxID=63121 RepID=UPI00396A1D17